MSGAANLPAMMDLRYRFRSWRYRTSERLLLKLMFRLPSRWKDRLTLHRMGELTGSPALAHVEVPTVTIQQLMRAMDA